MSHRVEGFNCRDIPQTLLRYRLWGSEGAVGGIRSENSATESLSHIIVSIEDAGGRDWGIRASVKHSSGLAQSKSRLKVLA